MSVDEHFVILTPFRSERSGPPVRAKRFISSIVSGSQWRRKSEADTGERARRYGERGG